MVEHEVPDDDDHRDEAEALEHRDDVHRAVEAVASTAVVANSGAKAMSGIAARSWNSSTEKPRRPCRVARSPVSSITCRAKAVDDSASAKPANSAVCHEKPSEQADARQHQRR